MTTTTLVDIDGGTHPFDRFFLRGIGSCHAYLTLREDFRKHVRLAQKEIGFGGIRFHGIFNDRVGVIHGKTITTTELPLNFQNVTKIYEFFVAQGMKPFVELGFMPPLLSSGDQAIFAYRANVTPPADWSQWSQLVRRFVAHLVGYFGLEEVLAWHFEVWNEPDLLGAFWTGTQEEYFRLYVETARAVKAVHPRLRVGGPATSKTMWIPEFLRFCAAARAPLDFISTHHYCVDAALIEDGQHGPMRYRGVPAMRADVERVRAEIAASEFPNVELHFTEWNASPAHEDVFGKDTAFTAAFALQTIKDVSGLVDSYMWWTVSDIFEESGLSRRPFTGKYGLVNQHGIMKPVFHAFRWLAQMHARELTIIHPSARVCRSAEGEVRGLVWNLPDVIEANLDGGDWSIAGQTREERFRVLGLSGRYRVRLWIVDDERGNALHAWRRMGAPDYLKPPQAEALQMKSDPTLLRDDFVELADGPIIGVRLPPGSFAFFEISRN